MRRVWNSTTSICGVPSERENGRRPIPRALPWAGMHMPLWGCGMPWGDESLCGHKTFAIRQYHWQMRVSSILLSRQPLMNHTFLRHARRLPLIRIFFHHPRLTLSLGVALAAFSLLTIFWPGHVTARLLFAYNLGAILYLVLAGYIMMTAQVHQMRRRALQQDDGRVAVLLSVVIASGISLIAIAAQLSAAKDFTGLVKYAHVSLAAVTVLTSWSFTQVMFALHYAHEYYGGSSSDTQGGLEFPGTTEPDYLDFLYVACVIGTSGQTADVSFANGSMRRLGLIHCVLSFFYNATLIALTINIAAGLM